MDPAPGQITAVLLDVDGTLIDSAPGIIAGYRRVLEHFALPEPSTEALMADIGPSLEVIMSRWGVPKDHLGEATTVYRAFYQAQGAAMASVYPGVVDMLDGLRSAGFRLATATAKRTSNAAAVLDTNGLASYFDVIGAAEDPDRRSKAAIIGWTLEQLAVPAAAAAMVGDRHYDIDGAVTCGVAPIGVTWGYGTDEELRSAGATSVIDSPDQLQPLL